MSTLHAFSERFFPAIEALLPKYLADPVDQRIAEGNVACMLLDESGAMVAKMFGTDKARQRQSCQVAWKKATQVWMTGVATYQYEKKVYAGELRWWEFGLPLPELIGWEGGLPGMLDDGTKVALTFSGFRGDKDCEILREAAALVGGVTIA